MQKLNKRLYEDCIVREMIAEAIRLALQKNISEEQIEEFVEQEFTNIFKKTIQNE